MSFSLQPVVLRPAYISSTRAAILQVQFPNYGSYSATTNLGIAWSNPADHTQPLTPLQGFDFGLGFGYVSLNIWTTTSTKNAGDTNYAIGFFVVDKNGADLYQATSSSVQMQSGFFNYDTISLGVSAGAVVGNGIRCQFTGSATGNVTITVPQIVLFFGDLGPT